MYQNIYIQSIDGYTLKQPSKATLSETDVQADGSGRALSAKAWRQGVFIGGITCTREYIYTVLAAIH